MLVTTRLFSELVLSSERVKRPVKGRQAKMKVA
jgi:hypothetical protein